MRIFKKRDKSCLDTRVLKRLRKEAELKVYLEFSRSRDAMILHYPNNNTSLYSSEKHWEQTLLRKRREYILNNLYDLKVERNWKINEAICEKLNNKTI